MLKNPLFLYFIFFITFTGFSCTNEKSLCKGISMEECKALKSLLKTSDKKIVDDLIEQKIDPKCVLIILGSDKVRLENISCQKDEDCSWWNNYWEYPLPVNKDGFKKLERFSKLNGSKVKYCKETLSVSMTMIPPCYPNYENCVTPECVDKKCKLNIK